MLCFIINQLNAILILHTLKQMKIFRISIFIVILLYNQSSDLLAQNDTLYSPFDYYTGGRNALGKHICDNVIYPTDARFKGVDGLIMFSFKINCENEPYDITFQTTLGYGIEESVRSVLENTRGKWVKCDDLPRDIQMSIKLAFSINSVYMPKPEEVDFFIIAVMTGQKIMTDKELTERVNSLNKKGKYKQARKYLIKLIHRYPFDRDYQRLLINIDQKINTK